MRMRFTKGTLEHTKSLKGVFSLVDMSIHADGNTNDVYPGGLQKKGLDLSMAPILKRQ